MPAEIVVPVSNTVTQEKFSHIFYPRNSKINGKLGKMYKNPTYTDNTVHFWNSCNAICNEKYWHLWGIPNCGKGQPMQVGHVGHGAAPARFNDIRVGVLD